MQHMERVLGIIGTAAIGFGSSLATDALAQGNDTDLRPGGSSEVLYQFPKDPGSISVSRGGETTMALEIPTFPSYVRPKLYASYSSRGGDGPMGMGWDIGVANITFDTSNGYSVLSNTGEANLITTTDGHSLLANRWVSNPGGKLTCEVPSRGAAGWWDYDCFTNPRGAVRYRVQVDSSNMEIGFTAEDPYEGITQEFGVSDAGRIKNSEGREVAFLLQRESNRWGREVAHFYEESLDSYERLRVAMLMGGNKTIRFVYTAKSDLWPSQTPLITSSYRLGTLRKTNKLLTEIQLLDNCTPTQNSSTTTGAISTSYSGSGCNSPIEKIEITYADPSTRFTGRYVLQSWQHMSGDESVKYSPATFEYNGDNLKSKDGTSAVNLLQQCYEGDASSGIDCGAAFSIPSGHVLGNGSFHNYMDFNRDGLADWISKKSAAADSEFLPDATPSDGHVIEVRTRNESGGFESTTRYDDPLAKYAFWFWKDETHFDIRSDRPDIGAECDVYSSGNDYCQFYSSVFSEVGTTFTCCEYETDLRPDEDVFYSNCPASNKSMYTMYTMTVTETGIARSGGGTYCTGRPNQISIDETADLYSQAIEVGWNAAVNIGINARPWISMDYSDGASSYYNGKYESEEGHQQQPPIFEQLSMSVPCERLGDEICNDLKNTFRCVWSGDTTNCEGTADDDWDDDKHLGVKLTDLQDMNGDGYLDRVVSGLLVVWDQNQTENNGIRDILNDPAIYVSRFDPNEGDFVPFEKYEIELPSGDVSYLSATFVSALGIEITTNDEPTSNVASNQTAISASRSVIGLTTDVLGISNDIVTNVNKGQGATSGISAQTWAGLAFSVADVAIAAAGVPPEKLAGYRALGTAYSAMGTTMNTANAIEGVSKTSIAALAAEKGISTGAASTAGWANFTSAMVGVVGMIAQYGVSEFAQTRAASTGYNAMVVSNNAKSASAAISIVTAAVSLAATIIAVSVGALALGPVGWVIAIVGFVVAIAYSVIALESAEIIEEYEEGEVKGDVRNYRGVVWRDNSTASDITITSKQLLNWLDITADGRVDLVVSKYRHAQSGYAVAPGNVIDGYISLQTGAWQTWNVDDSDEVDALSANETDTHFELQHVSRGDQTDVTMSLMDMNGDGLPDIVGASDTDLVVHLNHVGGFDAAITWSQTSGASVASCSGVQTVLSRSRGMSWTELNGNDEGYGISMNNVTQTLMDMNGDGLPDLVWKDEATLGDDLASDDCVKDGGLSVDMCNNAMPVSPEPFPESTAVCMFLTPGTWIPVTYTSGGYSECSGTDSASDVWYAQLDNELTETPCYNGGPDVTPHFAPNYSPGEGYSLLTHAAQTVFSPKSEATHYVAYNTGNGFTQWYEMDEKIPALSGGFSIGTTTTAQEGYASPYAFGGQSNFIGDPDASGQNDLIVLDIDNSLLAPSADWDPTDVDDPNTPAPYPAPVYKRYRLGIANADALTKVTYPEGGTVEFSYDIHRDIGGEQGPPLWVLSHATLDDGVSLGDASWESTKPFVDYSYTGAKLVDREFLGFEAIGETRFSGTDVTQVMEVYDQEGPDRGAILCNATFGKTLYDGDAFSSTDKLKTTCSTADVVDPATASPAGNTANSCYSNLGALFSTVHPLQKQLQYTYNTSHTQYLAREDGTTEDILRDMPMLSTTTTVFNGSSNASVTTLRVNYDGDSSTEYAHPEFLTTASTSELYRTPRWSEVSAEGATKRVVQTTWDHHVSDEEWLFLKTKEQKRDHNLNEVIRTDIALGASPTYALASTTETDVATGQVRSKQFGNYNEGGQAGSITENGCTSNYVYYRDGETGTSQLRSSQGCTDADANETNGGRAVAGIESYQYDAMGRTLFHWAAGTSEFTGIQTQFTYDALGVLESDRLPGYANSRTYTHMDVGNPMLASTTRTSTANLQTITEITYWDGFNRKYKSGQGASGAYTVNIDYDGDGNEFTSFTQASAKDATLLANRTVQKAMRLNAVGEVQCESMVYFSDASPSTWRSALYDAERRIAINIDTENFKTWNSYSVNSSGEMTGSSTNDLLSASGKSIDTIYNTWLQKVSEDQAGLLTATYEYNDWDGLVRTTNGRGAVAISELNAWNQPVKTCVQEDLSVSAPSTNTCTGLATTSYHYDGFGWVDQVTDANGNVTTTRNGACGANRVDKPTIASDSSLSYTATMYDLACRPVSQRALNGSTTTQTYDASTGQLTETTLASGLTDEASDPGYVQETSTRTGYDGFGRALYVENDQGYRTYSIPSFRNQVLYVFSPTSSSNAFQTNTYDVYGFLTSSMDAMGHTTSMTYNTRGEVKTKSNAAAEQCTGLDSGTWMTVSLETTESYAMNAAGRVTDVTHSDGTVWHTEYDDLGRVTASCNPHLVDGTYNRDTSSNESKCTITTYDAAGNIESTTSFAGVVNSFEYDGVNRIKKSVVDVGGLELTTKTDYVDHGQTVWTHPPVANHASSCIGADTAKEYPYSTKTTYNSWGLVSEVQGPQDQNYVTHKVSTQYDAAGRAIVVTNARNYNVQTEFDALNRPWRVTLPDGTQTKTTYDTLGHVISTQDARGIVTSVNTYDTRGRLVEVSPDAGGSTVYEYNEGNQPTCRLRQTDTSSAPRWDGMYTTYTTDGLVESVSAVISTTDSCSGSAAMQSTHTCYDAMGRVVGYQDGNGNISQVTYTKRNQKNCDKLARSSSSASWEQACTYYDDDGHVTSFVAPMGGSSGPSYVTTNYSYDHAGRVISETFPEATDKKVYSYDDNGNICSISDMNGATTDRSMSYTYDARGLATKRVLSTGTTEQWSFNENGKLTAATDASGSWSYSYNSVDQLTSQTQSITRSGAAWATFTTGFEYYGNGILKKITYPTISNSASLYSPQYEEFTLETGSNRLSRVFTGRGTVAGSFTYDGANRATQYSLGNGAVQIKDYDEVGRINHRQVSFGSDQLYQTFGYDSANNLTSVDDHLDNNYDASYGYDGRNRLISFSMKAAKLNSVEGSYSYQLNSQNRMETMTFTPTSGTATNYSYTYDSTKANLSSYTDGSNTYRFTTDNYGNRIQKKKGSTAQGSYGFDAANRMNAYGTTSASAAVVYAHDTRRVWDGSTKAYVYGVDRLPLAELTVGSTGSVTGVNFNVYLGGNLAQTMDRKSGSTVDIRYYATNPQGSPDLVMQASSTSSMERLAYGPWGQTYAGSGGTATSLSKTKIGFQSNYKNDTTGFSLMGARYYDPATYAFISTDPIGLGGGISRTAFTNANPMMFTDRSGLSPDAYDSDKVILSSPDVTVLDTPEGILQIFANGTIIYPNGAIESNGKMLVSPPPTVKQSLTMVGGSLVGGGVAVGNMIADTGMMVLENSPPVSTVLSAVGTTTLLAETMRDGPMAVVERRLDQMHGTVEYALGAPDRFFDMVQEDVHDMATGHYLEPGMHAGEVGTIAGLFLAGGVESGVGFVRFARGLSLASMEGVSTTSVLQIGKKTTTVEQIGRATRIGMTAAEEKLPLEFTRKFDDVVHVHTPYEQYTNKPGPVIQIDAAGTLVRVDHFVTTMQKNGLIPKGRTCLVAGCYAGAEGAPFLEALAKTNPGQKWVAPRFTLNGPARSMDELGGLIFGQVVSDTPGNVSWLSAPGSYFFRSATPPPLTLPRGVLGVTLMTATVTSGVSSTE